LRFYYVFLVLILYNEHYLKYYFGKLELDNEFVAYSHEMQEVKKLISLVKGINVNTIIMGDVGVGKSLVAKMIIPNAIVVYGDKPEDVLKALKNFDEIIIEDFEKLPSSDLPLTDGKKIVATAQKRIKDSTLDRLFGIKIDIPPLSQRAEDITGLTDHFLAKAKKELGMKSDSDINLPTPDISQNCHSLKRSVYQALLCSNVSKEQLGSIMEEYFYAHIDDEDENYKPFLDVFDSAVINANYRKFKSQLMMSYKMGINRNTLRKKILQLGKKLGDE
jgi:DNA-binding NtrC family response regulator